MNKFEQLVTKITSKKHFDQIFSKQIKFLDIKPFHIQKICPQTAIKLYIQTKSRYPTEFSYEESQNMWHQNQRRVFVWYIVVFLYQHNINPAQINKTDFNQLSQIFFHKNPKFLQYQYLNLVRIPYKIIWTQEEDRILLNAIEKQSQGKWNQISKRIYYQSNFELFHSPKHCRQRWFNHLDKSKQKGEWVLRQEYLLLKFLLQHGKKWSKIATLMGNKRTQHMIKNKYHALISKNRRSKKQQEDDIVSKLFKSISSAYKLQKNESKKQKSNMNQKTSQTQELKQSIQQINIKIQNNEQKQDFVKFQQNQQFYNLSAKFNQNEQSQKQFKNQSDSSTMKDQNDILIPQPVRISLLTSNQINQTFNQYGFQIPYWMYYIPTLVSNFQFYQTNEFQVPSQNYHHLG